MISETIDKPNCHQGTVLGTPNGILAIITMGELKGMILAHTATGLDLSLIHISEPTRPY